MDQSQAKLETSIKNHLAPILRKDGFAGSGRCYRRIFHGLIHIISVQTARGGGSFAINLAIHPTGIPDAVGHPVDTRRITEGDCDLRRRLSSRHEDHWWPYNDNQKSMDKAAMAAASVYESHGKAAFAHMTGPASPLDSVTASDLRSGNYNFSGFGATEARLCLLLARLRILQRRYAEAADFINQGISEAGPSTTIILADFSQLQKQLACSPSD
jgi:hypothetical protein